MRVLVLNGPNLNRLGTREPELYGSVDLPGLEERVAVWADRLGIEVDQVQSNREGELIELIHDATHDGIVINPGALTHTSRALGDAVASVSTPVVEVHISNVREREAWRRHSVLRGHAVASFYGRGLIGYRDALRHLMNRAAFDFETIGYGPHVDQVGDLRRGGSGLVMLLHGGFWRHEWTRDTMESLAVDLAERGHNTWNVEYRRIGTGGGWPATAHDVLTAIEFTPQLELDMTGAIVVGHSAGGQLAAWAASRASDRVERVVGLAPVMGLAAHEASRMYGSDEARSLLDVGAPRVVQIPDVPIDLFHGEDDQLVPPSQSSDFADRVNVHVVPGGHFDMLDPSHHHWPEVVELIQSAQR